MFNKTKAWMCSLILLVFWQVQAVAAESLLKLLSNNIKATDDDAVCLECHSDVSDSTLNFVHYPAGVGACSYCHTLLNRDHLNGDNPPGSMSINRKAENCYTCHERKDDKPVLHGALADEDSCVSCHNPHSSVQKYFLKEASVPALCATCHNVNVQGKSQHGPVINGKTCVSCHTPHSGNHEKMLNRPAKELCLSCHNREIKATLNGARTIPNIQQKFEGVVHPGAVGSCLDCHKAHVSENDRLLTAPWSIKNYNTYSERDNAYAMCFTCHDTSMLKPVDFVTDTNFRNDSKQLNLHWFHVVDAAGNEDKSRGRSCKICHDPHGAPQAHDINSTWFMNGNPIKIEYTETANGGQCTKSCHALRKYQRAN